MCILCFLAAEGGFGNVDRSKYRFYPVDFEANPNKPLHTDLILDITEKRITVESAITFENTGTEAIKVLSLDANKLSVHKVEVLTGKEPFPRLNAEDLPSNDWPKHCDGFAKLTFETLPDRTDVAEKSDDPLDVGLKASTEAGFDVNAENQKILITFSEPIAPGQQYVVRTITTCHPDDVELEGCYKDFHYKGEASGLPRNMITQFQQYGYQRVMPNIDQMPSKMMYRSKIIADARYNTIITSGDLSEGYYTEEVAGNRIPAPKPSPKADFKYAEFSEAPENDRVVLEYQVSKVPMATYLYFFTVGFYTKYSQVYEYPDGKMFEMQLLLHPAQAKPVEAVRKLEMLHDVFTHTYISLGPEATLHKEDRARFYSLMKRREELKRKQRRVIIGSTASFDGKVYVDDEKVDAKGDITFDESAKTLVGADATLSAADEAELATVRAELAELIKKWTQFGYQYDYQAYREIAMSLSHYGGMENTQNTTIVKSSICPSAFTCDATYFYTACVCAHEYYHALNGSSVTSQSPFSLFLNEAATVQIGERAFADHLFGHEYCRLRHVIAAHMPLSGALSMDSLPGARPIIPEGFNTTLELITAVTYAKAPEVLNMIRVMMGEHNFNKAFWNYYAKYQNRNATTDEWLACFEEVAGRSFKDFAKGWFFRAGFPTLHYSSIYDAATKKYTVELKQTGFENLSSTEPWEFPISYGVVTGDSVVEGVHIISSATDKIVVDADVEPDYVSVARNWSFFGKSVCHDDDAVENPFVSSKLLKQALSDTDAVNRMLAYRALGEIEKERLIAAFLANNGPVTVNPQFIDLTVGILLDPSVSMSTKVATLSYLPSVEKAELSTQYWLIHDARVAICRAMVAHSHDALYELLKSVNTDEMLMAGDQAACMHHRSLKAYLANVFFAAYCTENIAGTAAGPHTPIAPRFNLAEFAISLFRRSAYMTDKVTAAGLIVNMLAGDSVPQIPATSFALDKAIVDGYFSLAVDALMGQDSVRLLIPPEKLTTFPEYPRVTDTIPSIHPEDKARFIAALQQHFLSSDNGIPYYFGAVGTSIAGVNAILAMPEFKINRPDHARTLARQWASVRKVALLSKEGIAHTGTLINKIASVNEMSAVALIQGCGDLPKIKGEAHISIKGILETALETLTALKKFSSCGAIKTVLKSIK